MRVYDIHEVMYIGRLSLGLSWSLLGLDGYDHDDCMHSKPLDLGGHDRTIDQ